MTKTLIFLKNKKPFMHNLCNSGDTIVFTDYDDNIHILDVNAFYVKLNGDSIAINVAHEEMVSTDEIQREFEKIFLNT